MTQPTQAQIEAAAKAMRYIDSETYPDNWYQTMADAALTAAAEVGETKLPWREHKIVHGSNAAVIAAIERCAEVAEEYDGPSGRHGVAAAIRALKDKP